MSGSIVSFCPHLCSENAKQKPLGEVDSVVLMFPVLILIVRCFWKKKKTMSDLMGVQTAGLKITDVSFWRCNGLGDFEISLVIGYFCLV